MIPRKVAIAQIEGLKQKDPQLYETARSLHRAHNDLVGALGPGGEVKQGDFVLSAGLGATAFVTIAAGSTFKRGEFTLTCQGGGLAANPTVTLKAPEGLWTAQPWAVVQRNGGTGTLSHTASESSVAPFSLTITLVGTPTAGHIYIFRYSIRD